MEIVINIPNFEWLKNEEDFKAAVKEYEQGTRFDKEIRNALINGTPLPKGHGGLIDVDNLREDFKSSRKIAFADRMDISCIIDHAPTIIEADKEI